MTVRDFSNTKKSTAAILGSLFVSTTFLEFSLIPYRFYTQSNWKYALEPLGSVIIYSVCGLIVLNKWQSLPLRNKGSLIGISAQYVMFLLYMIWTQYYLVGKSFSPLIGSLLEFYPIRILSPFEILYFQYIIEPNSIHNAFGAMFRISHWEQALIIPLLRASYGGVIGFSFGMLIDGYQNGAMRRVIEDLRKYSVSAFLSIIAGFIGYLLLFNSESLFIFFAPLSILAILAGHISHRRISQSNSQLKGQWVSVAGLLLGYTLFSITVIIFMRFNRYV
jgi:hypothetical protein